MIGHKIKEYQQIVDLADPLFIERLAKRHKENGSPSLMEVLSSLDKQIEISKRLNKDTKHLYKEVDVVYAYMALQEMVQQMRSDLENEKPHEPDNSLTFS